MCLLCLACSSVFDVLKSRGPQGRKRGVGFFGVNGGSEPHPRKLGVWKLYKLPSGVRGKASATQSFGGILLLRKHVFKRTVYYQYRCLK